MSWFDRDKDSPEDHYCGTLDPPCARCGRMDDGCVTVTSEDHPGEEVNLCNGCADDVMGVEQIVEDPEDGPLTLRSHEVEDFMLDTVREPRVSFT